MRKIQGTIAAGLFTIFTGCSAEMNQLGSSILSSTGYVSGSQADAIFTAGSKLSKAAESVTDEQEYYLGRAVAATILSRYDLVQNASATSYLNKVAAVLASHSSRPETFAGYRVGILNTPEINAVSAPGGFIFISKGFLKTLESEDELAAIIAHEIGHIALKHGTAAISEANLTSALSILGRDAIASSGTVGIAELNTLFGDSVEEVVKTVLDKGYSRSQEYNSDEYSATLLRVAGYNPAALVSALKKLEQGRSETGGWFETHPDAADRIDEIGEVVSIRDADVAKRTTRFQAAMKSV